MHGRWRMRGTPSSSWLRPEKAVVHEVMRLDARQPERDGVGREVVDRLA